MEKSSYDDADAGVLDYRTPLPRRRRVDAGPALAVLAGMAALLAVSLAVAARLATIPF
jgi:hypothetical protein